MQSCSRIHNALTHLHGLEVASSSSWPSGRCVILRESERVLSCLRSQGNQHSVYACILVARISTSNRTIAAAQSIRLGVRNRERHASALRVARSTPAKTYSPAQNPQHRKLLLGSFCVVEVLDTACLIDGIRGIQSGPARGTSDCLLCGVPWQFNHCHWQANALLDTFTEPHRSFDTRASSHQISPDNTRSCRCMPVLHSVPPCSDPACREVIIEE
ncbi:hypothetical protein F4780DRAFT_250656 [Xylariomycetidae sp. FL0641]|nr:hypothetical protein F4780DRAFT_250656 [Xylariomycetidae sp. FL0641]